MGSRVGKGTSVVHLIGSVIVASFPLYGERVGQNDVLANDEMYTPIRDDVRDK